MKEPIKVAVTGAAGQIGYALLFRIASGALFGKDQPVILQLLEIPPALPALEGVCMELTDCTFPLLMGLKPATDAKVAFQGVDYALLVGSRPRSKGMERKDLIEANAKIFSEQGKALNECAARDVRVLVVGNPANTNCLIAQRNAPDLNPRHFTAMTRLDHNRAVAQLAEKLDVHTSEVEGVCIWGNHSATQYPDIHSAKVQGKKALEQVDVSWYTDSFIPQVQQRGAAIIEARGASSAASAASAAIDHVRDWAQGADALLSMGVYSDGSYGIEKGLIYSFPVTCKGGDWQIVQGIDLSDFSRGKMRITEEELLQERDAVKHLLPA